MDGRRLDEIAKLLALGASRRRLLVACVPGILGAFLSSDRAGGAQLCRDYGADCSPTGFSDQCCTGFCRRSPTADHACDCPPGTTYCRDPTGFELCTDTGIDEQNCGACGRVCRAPTGASPTCADGTCRFETSVFVAANQQNGVDTGIDVSAGQLLCVAAEGVAYFCSATSSSCFSDPNGSPVFAYATCVNTAFPCGTLLGRIGRDGRTFRVGAKRCFPASRPGPFYLLVNDARYQGSATDNRGGYTVTISG